MATASGHDIEKGQTTIIRVGGLLGLLALVIHAVVNFFLFEPAPATVLTDVASLKTYISEHADTMAMANGLRNLAFFCLPFFAVGLYTLTARGATLVANVWGIAGLLGTAALGAALSIANGIQTLMFVNIGSLSERPEMFLLFGGLTRVLFTAAEAFFPTMLVGFSLAGWRSAAVPRWLVVLGLVLAATYLLIAVGMASAIRGGWAGTLWLVAQPMIMIWFLCTSVLMVRRA